MTYNGRTLTWDGRRLIGTDNTAYTYNEDGIRIRKQINNIVHTYTVDGSQIISEAWNDIYILYLYDESGAPIGLRYRTAAYAEGVFDTYF